MGFSFRHKRITELSLLQRVSDDLWSAGLLGLALNMIINNLNYEDVAFIHIPKTGGQSVFSAVNSKNLNKHTYTEYANHDPLFVLEKENTLTRCFKFTVVRNPYRRAYSHYKHFNKINNTHYTFLEFLNFIWKSEVFDRTPMMLYTQTFFCLNSSGDIGITRVYKYEKLHELEKELGITLPHINRGSYVQDDLIKDYCKEARDTVLDLFNIDFRNFDYPTDFDA